MNIFPLHRNPVEAAKYLCDNHINKMFTETGQILCTTATMMGYETPWAPTHAGHPVHKWVKHNRHNWDWLVRHGIGIMRQWGNRSDNPHKSVAAVMWARRLNPDPDLFDHVTEGITPFQLSVYPKYEGSPLDIDGCIDQYHKYYRLKEYMWWELARIRCLANYAHDGRSRKGHRPIMTWTGGGIRGDFMGEPLEDFHPDQTQLEAAESWARVKKPDDFNPKKLTLEQQLYFAQIGGCEMAEEEIQRKLSRRRVA